MLTDITENPLILIVLFVAQIGLVIWLTAGIQRMSPALAATVFFAYAALNGVLFSFIFELYTTQSIFTTFLITAGMFGAMAAWGYFTDMDLSRLGAVLFMALIGLILATVVNISWPTTRSTGSRPTRAWRSSPASRLRHAEAEAVGGARRRRGQHGGPGRAGAVPGLHQPVPVPASHLRPVAVEGIDYNDVAIVAAVAAAAPLAMAR